MQSIVIGPIALGVPQFLVMFGLVVSLATSYVLRRKGNPDPERHLIFIFLAAIVVGRSVFIAMRPEHYLQDPWSIINLRDGGISVAGAVAALLAGAGLVLWRNPALRRSFTVAFSAGLLAWATLSYGWNVFQAGIRMPEVELVNSEGEPVSLSSFHGKPTVVNLWATWCPPCRREMPVLAEAQQQNPDVHFVFVNQGESATPIARFLDGQALKLENVLLDQGYKLGREFGGGLPTTLFLDARGRQVTSHMGELSAGSLDHALDQIRQE